MVRMLIRLAIELAANALGLIAAAVLLEKVVLSGAAFVVAVVVFTIVDALAQPFLTQLALSTASALRGGVALVATLVALIVTSLVSDGLSISGALTWVQAALIVWVVSLLGALVLPLIFLRNKAQQRHEGR